jgi:TatD DNase family protein
MDFMSNAREVALDADKLGMRLFANTVTPSGFIRARKLLGDLQNVQVGLGLHPWWVREADVGDFVRLSGETSWIGEVGLDVSPKRAHHEDQLAAFIRIARTCAEQGDKTLSIHSVRAASTVLDVLEETGCCASCRCIFHWFSGSTEDLWRAIRLGCWFSVNEMQASTRRAKEQLKLIPSDRMLLETDLPPSESSCASATDIVSSLERTLTQIEVIRNESVRKQVTYNWDTILLDA